MRKTVPLVLTLSFVLGLLLGTTSYAIIEQISQIRNLGTIRAIGVDVYQDEELTDVLDTISWGTLDPGEAKSFDAWVKNTGSDAQKLVLWTENWNPTAAQDGISLDWSYDDSWIAVNASVRVVFTLSVDSDISGVGSFSFDIWIKGVC